MKSLLLFFIFITLLAIPLASADLTAPTSYSSGYNIFGHYWDFGGQTGIQNGSISNITCVQNCTGFTNYEYSIGQAGSGATNIAANNTNIESILLGFGQNRTILIMNGTYITDHIPRGDSIFGISWNKTILATSNTQTNIMSVNASACLNTLSVQDAYTGNGYPAGTVRGIQKYCNYLANPTNPTFYPNTMLAVDGGDNTQQALQWGGAAINQFGYGDAYWAGVVNGGTGVNIFTNQNNRSGDGVGLASKSWGTGPGIWVIQYGQNYAPDTGVVRIIAANNSDLLSLTALNATAPLTNRTLLGETSSTITTGNFIKLFQSTSAYTGDAIIANLGYGSGSFSGNFLKFQKNSANIYAVNDTGAIMANISGTVGYICKYANNATLYFSAGACNY